MEANKSVKCPSPTLSELNSLKKSRNVSLKRKRCESDSIISSDDDLDELPENILQTEKILNASAIKNNLNETGVRKIIKTVVKNDHVLAYVKLREEEEMESGTQEREVPTKITRSKAKELMKVSPKIAWKIPVDLCPIKHIPVKTRPEVKALIAQELPEDEDDDEYQPTADDIPSDDDQAESCSDLDSQPRTPATPGKQKSPKVVQDGPFKIPQTASAAKRKLELDEEEATIARRTRSKLSLSSTPIEHIESTFVPPDDIPMPVDDDLWNQFLNECLNPASTSRNEDDDEADPEYNVAADPDANDEDEDNLSKSIIKISKKELNDLVTELFNFMPESTEDVQLAENLANSVLTGNARTDVSHWEGKQEPTSDDETIKTLHDNYENACAGKKQVEDIPEHGYSDSNGKEISVDKVQGGQGNNKSMETNKFKERGKLTPSLPKKRQVDIMIREEDPVSMNLSKAPPSLRKFGETQDKESYIVHVHVSPGVTVLPQQVLLLQQQLRQHIQLAASNFLQIFIHPYHWSYASDYKEYLETFIKMYDANPNTVANVCNLQPALELVTSWEKNMAKDTPENAEVVKFYQEQCSKNLQRVLTNTALLCEFHATFKEIVSNSTVFLYPHLLPPAPYRPDVVRRRNYVRSEDELIALGLDQFWQYVESNTDLFKIRKAQRPWNRPGLAAAVDLVARHMFPWTTGRLLVTHILKVRHYGDISNPITKFLKTGQVTPVAHRLLPFNPKMTLYEHSETEMPRIWIRHLAKKCKRFKFNLHRSTVVPIQPPAGVLVDFEKPLEVPQKVPLPIDLVTDEPQKNKQRTGALPDPGIFSSVATETPSTEVLLATNIYSMVETSTGPVLIPLKILQSTNTVNAVQSPVTTAAIVSATAQPQHENRTELPEKETAIQLERNHCQCCTIMQKITKGNQKQITDYFSYKNPVKSKKCFCSDVSHPKISNRLKIFVKNYKCQCETLSQEIEYRSNSDVKVSSEMDGSNPEDLAFVTSYQIRLTMRMSHKKSRLKNRIHTIFSQFDADSGNPVKLAKTLHRAVNSKLMDVYTDFLGFLTPEQAEEADVFKNYLASHVRDVLRIIDEEVTVKEKRNVILSELKSILYGPFKHKPCEMCSLLLKTMEGHPRLAQHWFSLFSHKREQRSNQERCTSKVINESQKQIAGTVASSVSDNTSAVKIVPMHKKNTETATDPSDDKSDSNEDSGEESSSSDDGEEENIVETTNQTTNQDIENHIIKIEVVDESEDTDLLRTEHRTEVVEPMLIAEEDVKTEVEWKRDEDKIILEVIKHFIVSQNGSDKSILEIMEEKDVYRTLADVLTDKTLEDIKSRVLYLLEMVLLNQS